MPPRLRPRPAAWTTPKLSPALDRRRCFSCCSPAATPAVELSQTSETATLPAPSAKWLSELQARIGKCIVFGCSPAQVSQAAVVLRALATEWRELTAGSQGFLTGGRRGLEDHKVVWGVMDSFQHVNNVTYFRYAEGSRVNWITNFALNVDPANGQQWRELMTPRSVGLIMKSIKADFKLPMTYPDTISVYHKLRAWPPDGSSSSSSSSSSILLDCVVLSHRHRRASARLEEEVVTYDYRAGAKTPIPAFARAVFAETWALQRREEARARARIAELYALVARLERGTWDRPDAVEDLGGGGGVKQ